MAHTIEIIPREQYWCNRFLSMGLDRDEAEMLAFLKIHVEENPSLKENFLKDPLSLKRWLQENYVSTDADETTMRNLIELFGQTMRRVVSSSPFA